MTPIQTIDQKRQTLYEDNIGYISEIEALAAQIKFLEYLIAKNNVEIANAKYFYNEQLEKQTP